MNIATRTLEINHMEGHKLTVSINAKFTRQFWIRYYVALWLMKLAGRILHVDIDLQEDER